MKSAIDPIDAQPRCVHDMINGTCSWCKGLPDVPDLDVVFHHIDDRPPPPLRWVSCEQYTDCARCGGRIGLGQPAAFSRVDGGSIGECCESAA